MLKCHRFFLSRLEEHELRLWWDICSNPAAIHTQSSVNYAARKGHR
jgi:hypothetical protein